MTALEHATFPENQEYHDGDGLSWSKFKHFLTSPLQYDYLFGLEGVGVKESPEMTFGSYVHSLVLEPHLTSKHFQPIQDMPLRSNADKLTYIDWLILIEAISMDESVGLESMKADDLRALALQSTIRFFSHEDYAKGQQIANLLHPYFPDVNRGNVEAAFHTEIDGVRVKCKIDHIDNAGTIKDIKTCSQLDKWLGGLSYGDQLCGDAWYRMVIREATGTLPPTIEYVGVSTVEPFQVCVRSHHERDFYLAEMRIREGLKRFKECQDSGVWPGVDATPEARKVEVRPYTKRQWEIEVYGTELTMDSAMEQISALEYWTE